eukprot:1157826-Pelagomonas_calceolata.AAC.5
MARCRNPNKFSRPSQQWAWLVGQGEREGLYLEGMPLPPPPTSRAQPSMGKVDIISEGSAEAQNCLVLPYSPRMFSPNGNFQLWHPLVSATLRFQSYQLGRTCLISRGVNPTS